MLELNTTLQDRYIIQSLIGKGGMGEVYLAKDTKYSTDVAIKIALHGDDDVLREAAAREAEILKRLQHPNLPRVWDYFTEDNTQYLVMQYIPGKNLAERLAETATPTAVEQVLNWANVLIDILEYLHGHKPPVLHRDIKPQNIKITDRGELFLLDFGLVKDTPTRLKEDSLPPSAFGYSHNYAPLEQINGDPTSVQTDIYGMAATLYHLITNVKPADALNRVARKIEGNPDPLVDANLINPLVSRQISDALSSGLEISCNDRIKSIGEFHRKLAGARHEPEQQPEPDASRFQVDIDNDKKEVKPDPVPRNTSWRKYIAAAAGVLILGLIAWLGYELLFGNEVKARKLLEEAEKIEKSEGLLSQIACSKYQEIQNQFGKTNVAKESVSKFNACTNGQSLLTQAEAKEKEKGLNSDTADAFKKIVDAYPGSTFAKQAEKKIAAFEKTKLATVQAWKDMQNIDNDTQFSSQPTSEERDNLTKIINKYELITLENVDPVFADHIRNTIGIYKEIRTVMEGGIQDIESALEKRGEKRAQCEDAWKNTSTMVTTEQCIQAWILEEAKKFATAYEKKRAPLSEKHRGLNARDKSISTELSDKYKVPFDDLS